MQSTIAMRRAASAFCANTILLAAPVAAVAADLVVRSIEDDAGKFIFWAGMFFVEILTLMGYIASSLPQWTDWTDGTKKRRLELIASVFASVIAGNGVYYGGLYAIGWAQIYCFLATPFAAFAGDKFIVPVATRLSDAVGALFVGPRSNGGPKP